MQSENYIIYVTDTETTGTDYEKNEIVELSMLRLFLDSEKEPEQKTWLIRATDPSTISDEALAVSGHKKEDILGISKYGKENYKLPSDVLPEIENWISDDDATVMDRVLAGHNVLFDYSMLEGLWKRQNTYDTFPFQIGPNKLLIDTKAIALFIDILVGHRRKYYNLGAIVKAYGVKKEKAHKADADTRMARDVLMKQIEPFRKIAKEIFNSTYSDE